MSAVESHCARCLRPLEGGDWESLVDCDGEVIAVVCEDCITPEEQQAMDEHVMELDDDE